MGKIINKIKNVYYVFTLVILLLSLFFIFLPADEAKMAETGTVDAVAVRVIPNSEHYSAQSWYQKEQFTGSPQSIEVDGYKAVRSGRTVYVGAANESGGTLYTNIYLISYSLGSDSRTTDLYGQMLSHWKFNNNITGTGSCSKSASTICYAAVDCPSGEYCTSQKAKIVRDTIRLGAIYEIKDLLETYRSKNNAYPNLAAGSYISGKTISTWPSWQNSLSKDLKKKLPVDPINLMDGCSGTYNKITCWDEYAKKMKSENYDHVFGASASPDDRVLSYQLTSADGSAYKLCSFLESGLTLATGGSCVTN